MIGVDADRVIEIFAPYANEPRWLVWREELRGVNRDRRTKVPYDAKDPSSPASSTDPATWAPLVTALEAMTAADFSGIGIVLGNGLGGIDLDACRDAATGEIAHWARKVIDGFSSYAEVSPSGLGVKIFASGAPADLPAHLIPVRKHPALQPGDKRPAIECYVTSRYFAVTGEILTSASDEIRDCGDVGGPWDRIVRSLAKHAVSRVECTPVEPTGNTEMSVDLVKALENNGKLRELWNLGTAGGHDRSRNDAALATTLAARGFGNEDIEAAIHHYRLGQIGQAALVGRDAKRRTARLLGLAQQAREHPVNGNTTKTDDAPLDLSHDSLALDMGAGWKDDMRHVAQWGKWFHWNGSVWAVDEILFHLTRTREYLRERSAQLDNWAVMRAEESKDGAKILSACKTQSKALRSSNTIAAVAMLARSNPDQAASIEQWDADPWVLGTPGGYIDLRTGELEPSDRERHITKATAITPAPPGTRCALWMHFLHRITGEDKSLQGYLQRFFGYALTGMTDEHAFAFGWGTGANGKSVCVGTIQGILGEYALEIPTEMLMVTKNDRHPTELARLRGVRLAIGSETEEGTRWAEARIKSLTGGDRIVARFMREDFFEFQPQFKLIVIGNHRPSLRGVDEAMRRRLHFIPFTVTIPERERDHELRDRLKIEWPAILRWMVDGCIAWQRQGLNPPEAVRAATVAYLSAEDSVSQWMDECTERNTTAWEPAGGLFGSWKRWAEAAGEFAGSQKRFAQILEERGLVPKRQPHTGIRGYLGARLIEANVENWKMAESRQGDAW